MMCRRSPFWMVLPLLLAALGCSPEQQEKESATLFQEIAFFQAVKIPVFADGRRISAASRAAPLIAGRPAIVRAMVDLPEGKTSATLTLTVEIAGQRFSATESLAAPSVASDPESGIVVHVPAEAMTADASFRVELAEVGGDVVERFPASGDTPLDAVVTGPLALHFIPYRVNGFVPDTSDAVIEGMRAAMMAQYPVTAVNITVREVEDRGVVDGNPLDELLVRTGEIQDADFLAGADPKVFYYGMATGVATREEFTGVTGTSESGGDELTRAYFAVGAAFGDSLSEVTLAHEIGHTQQLLHAPCDADQLVDDDFPQPDGSIGVEGFDMRTNTFLPPDTKDMMSNCYPRWISAYHYAIAAEHVILTQTF